MKTVDVLAFDLGASNGRAIVGRYDGEKITTTEVHRFPNNFDIINEIESWDFENLLGNIKMGFQKAVEQGFQPKSFGIDTWGVDYGLLDDEGNLLSNPRAYRGAKNEEMHDAWDKLGKREIFERTGIAALNFNTLYQLNKRVLEKDEELQNANALLLMPDLIGYCLTGVAYSEYTNVTTTNLFHVKNKDWDYDSIDGLSIPRKIFTEIDYPGHVRGLLKKEIADELGVEQIPLIAVGTHDTASAVAAIPLQKENVFCSSGTWSLVGIESDEAIVNDTMYDSNFSNEGTVQVGFRPLKNIMGMWIIQECRRQWGEHIPWKEIDQEVEKTKPFLSVINPNYEEFFSAGNMVEKIQAYCKRTNQYVPQTMGEISRVIFESLALMYRNVIETMAEIKGEKIKGLNITGGGIQNLILNQMTADCTGIPVVTGPIEGAALGNIIVQLMGLEEISDIQTGRQIIKKSVDMKEFTQKDEGIWEQQYQKLLDLLEQDEKMKQ